MGRPNPLFTPAPDVEHRFQGAVECGDFPPPHPESVGTVVELSDETPAAIDAAVW